MGKTILIAGAGQLGSRYLQGLAKVSIPLEIYVLDISQSSLRTAEERWGEVKASEKSSHSVLFVSDIRTVPIVIDLAIVSTSANIRATVAKNVSSSCEVKYWILEKVLAQSGNEIGAIAGYLVNAKAAWVNTPRRAMAWHQEIKKHLQPGVPVELTVSGGQWGLACNAIHFLDLVQWWTGEQLSSVNTELLAKDWFPSKRADYFEILGTLSVRFSGGSEAIFSVDQSSIPLIMTITQGGFSWNINEQCGEALRSDGFMIKGNMEFQSSIAKKITEDILTNGTCDLPSLAESADLHKPFLRDMLIHWNKWENKNVNLLPIT
jgi:hypothetical protein